MVFIYTLRVSADSHQAEVRRISGVSRTTIGHSIIHFDDPLEFVHYSGATQTYGKRSIQMQSRVALLTRNIVIKGDGQGEDFSYHFWNAQVRPKSDRVCETNCCSSTRVAEKRARYRSWTSLTPILCRVL